MMTKAQITNMTFEMVMDALSDDRKEALKKALNRNAILTSSYTLSYANVVVYHEGYYIECVGTRCKFTAWAFDNDGELTFARKPVESKLRKIWDDSVFMGKYGESDFEKWVA